MTIHRLLKGQTIVSHPLGIAIGLVYIQLGDKPFPFDKFSAQVAVHHEEHKTTGLCDPVRLYGLS